MKNICPNPNAKKPKDVHNESRLVSIYLISKKTSPSSPKNKPITTNNPKLVCGLDEVSHATKAVAINIKEVNPLKITAVILFSFTLKNKNRVSKITPMARGIAQ